MHSLTTYEQMFRSVENQREKLQLLIEIGADLKPLHPAQRLAKFRVAGCVSDTYVLGCKDKKGLIHFSGWSDALITRGYLVIIFRALDNLCAKDILSAGNSLEDFAKLVGIEGGFVPSRTNLFRKVYDHIAGQVEENNLSDCSPDIND